MRFVLPKGAFPPIVNLIKLCGGYTDLCQDHKQGMDQGHDLTRLLGASRQVWAGIGPSDVL